MQYKIESVYTYEDDGLDIRYIKALNNRFLNVDKYGNIEIRTLEELNLVIQLLESVNNFDSYLGYNGVIIHKNIITIHDSFIY